MIDDNDDGTIIYWPQGVRIVFSIPSPGTTGMLIEDILNARTFSLDHRQQMLTIEDETCTPLRFINFSHVLIMTGLETVGPGAKTNA